MNITLSQDEIDEALVSYVRDMGVTTENRNTEVTLVVGRTNKGSTATVSITKKAENPAPVPALVDTNEAPASEAEDTDPVFGTS